MMEFPRRQFLLLTVSAATLPGLSQLAVADAYPSRPIHLIIGFTPGAATDVIGRLFAQGAGNILGQQFVVENKPGAGSSIAAQYVARAAKDGYTLFVPALSSLTYEIANPDTAVNLSRDFAPVALLANGTFVLAVDPDLKLKSVADLIALAKAKPGQVLFGTVGAGSLPHLCAEMFAQRAGLKLTHVPYPGSPQVVTDLMSGRIMMTFNIASSLLGQITAGQVQALAVTQAKRSELLPNVPTMAEAGMPNFNASLWIGLLAPVGTPRPIVEQLAAAAHKAMNTPDMIAMLGKEGYEPFNAGPDEFAAFIKSEADRWSDVAHAAGRNN